MFDELVLSVDASTTVAVTTFALIYNISMSSIYNMAGKESSMIYNEIHGGVDSKTMWLVHCLKILKKSFK